MSSTVLRRRARVALALVLLAALFAVNARHAGARALMTPQEYLYATAPYPAWQDATIWCESRWLPWVTNEASGAMGLAQFMPGTWAWGGELFGIYGDPYNAYDAIDMMNAFFAAGYASHWECA